MTENTHNLIQEARLLDLGLISVKCRMHCVIGENLGAVAWLKGGDRLRLESRVRLSSDAF